MKCTDPKCCSSFQSSYLKVVPKRFLPPPLPVVHTRNGIELAKDDKDANYLSVYQNISLQNALIPYDYSCPSMDHDIIKQRLFSHCGLYFLSLKAKSLLITSKLVGESLKVVLKTKQRVRPLRVAAR